MKDYYYILGLPVAASKDEIKEAYRKLSKKFHPDVNLGDKYFEDRFKEIQEAYETLIDDIKRNNYDLKRQEGKPVSGDSETKYSPRHPYSNATTQSKEVKNPKVSIIGIILLICIILIVIFIILTNHGTESTSSRELSIPKNICGCNLKISDENIDIKKYSFEPEASVYVNNCFDSLYGNVDSIFEKEFEKKRKFDEDVEDFVRTITYHYIHNKLVKPPNTFKEKCFREVNNRLIKKILIDGNSDSTTLKYEYNNCNNDKLSSIKVYNKNGEKIALCNISYYNTQGIISIITSVRDWKSYSLDDLSKVISNYEIKIDKDCKVRNVKYIWTDGINQRREEETYNDKGLIVESKSYIIDKTERLLSSDIYEYQYDKMMNWIVKITNQNRITRRTIFYRNPNN